MRYYSKYIIYMLVTCQLNVHSMEHELEQNKPSPTSDLSSMVLALSPYTQAVREAIQNDNVSQVDQPLIAISQACSIFGSYNYLHIAAEYGSVNVAKWLINTHNFDVNRQTSDDEQLTPLMIASSKNHKKFVHFLIDDININPLKIDTQGMTALHHASTIYSAASFKRIVVKFPQLLYISDNLGRNVTHLIAQRNARDLLKFIYKNIYENEKFVNIAQQHPWIEYINQNSGKDPKYPGYTPLLYALATCPTDLDKSLSGTDSLSGSGFSGIEGEQAFRATRTKTIEWIYRHGGNPYKAATLFKETELADWPLYLAMQTMDHELILCVVKQMIDYKETKNFLVTNGPGKDILSYKPEQGKNLWQWVDEQNRPDLIQYVINKLAEKYQVECPSCSLESKTSNPNTPRSSQDFENINNINYNNPLILGPNDLTITSSQCGHFICIKCKKDWVERSIKNKSKECPTCPVCRAPLEHFEFEGPGTELTLWKPNKIVPKGSPPQSHHPESEDSKKNCSIQ